MRATPGLETTSYAKYILLGGALTSYYRGGIAGKHEHTPLGEWPRALSDLLDLRPTSMLVKEGAPPIVKNMKCLARPKQLTIRGARWIQLP